MRRAALLACAAASAAAQATIPLGTESSWFLDNTVQPQPAAWMSIESNPISLALKDLANDWYKVIGTPPITVDQLPAVQPYVGGPVVVFSINNSSLGSEEFTIVAGSNGYAPCINITGGDTRGLVYGIYHFSGDILGVDPFWYFGDIQPAYAGVIDVPADYQYSSGAPAFASRGSFNNDEDVSGYFHPDVLGESVYSAELANRLCEVLLRFRANTVIPSTFAFIDERHYRVVQARGMMLGNHHVMPVGNNVYAWPKGVPYAYRLNPGVFKLAWRTVMDYEQNVAGREMVYSLGYRGINDEPFWNQDPGCATDQCRGQTITEAIANQSALAASLPYTHKPRLVAYMWMELLALLEGGTLTLPPNVSCVWTDFPGSFAFQNNFSLVKPNDGFYAHIQMMSGVAGQETEFIPPRRIFARIWEFLVRAATAYGMINSSDSKFVPITFEAVYRYMYSPQSFNASSSCYDLPPPEARSAGRRVGRRGPVGWWPMPRAGCKETGSVTPQQAQDAFLLEFATRHYSRPENATALPAAAANIYGRYFNISYQSSDNGNDVGDHYLGTTLRNLIAPFEAAVDAGNRPASLGTTAQGLATFAAQNLPFVSQLFADASALQPYIAPGAASTFYAGHVMAQVGISYYHLLAFQATSAAAFAYLDGNTAGTVGNLTQAVDAFNSLLAVLRTAEGTGAWRGVYRADGWTWMWGSRAQLVHLLAHVQGQHQVVAPNNPYPDYAFMTYECGANTLTGCPSFPFSPARYNASFTWDAMPRVTCASDVPGSPVPGSKACSTTFAGITFSGASAQVGMFAAPLPQRAPLVIRYTLDGSLPSPTNGLVYSQFITVTGNTTVTAQSFDAATNAALLVPSVVYVVKA